MDIRKNKKTHRNYRRIWHCRTGIKEGEEAIRISRYSAAPAPVAYAPAPASAVPAATVVGTAPAEEKITGHVVNHPW